MTAESGSDAAADVPVPDGFGEPVGDPACWAARVCPECGRLADEEPPTRCPGCGALIDPP